jgi:hypothetical protein
MAKISANVKCGSLRGAFGGEANVYNFWPMQFTLVRDHLPRRMRSFDVEKLPI